MQGIAGDEGGKQFQGRLQAQHRECHAHGLHRCAKPYNGLLAVRITAAAMATSDEASCSRACESSSGADAISCNLTSESGQGGMTMARTLGWARAVSMSWSMEWEVAAGDRTDIKAGMVALSVRVRHGFNWLHCAAKKIANGFCRTVTRGHCAMPASPAPQIPAPPTPCSPARLSRLLRPGMVSPR